MNEHDAVDLMDRLSATVTVPPAAVDAAIAAGARTRRRRRWVLVAAVPVMALVVGGSIVAISTRDRGSAIATPGPSVTLPGHVPTPSELTGRWVLSYLNGHAVAVQGGGVGVGVARFGSPTPLPAGGFHVVFSGSDGCNRFTDAVGAGPSGQNRNAVVTSTGHLESAIGMSQVGCPPGVAHPGFVDALDGRYLRIVGATLETFTATGHHLASLVRSMTSSAELPGRIPTPSQLTGRWTLTWLDGHPFHQHPNASGPVRVSFDHTSPLPSGGFSLDVHGFDGCNSFSSGINPGPGNDKVATFSTDGVLHPGSLMIGAVGCLDPNVPQQRFITALANQYLRIVAAQLETFDVAGHHVATLVRQP